MEGAIMRERATWGAIIGSPLEEAGLLNAGIGLHDPQSSCVSSVSKRCMSAAAVGNQGVMVRLQLLPLPLANPELKTGSYTWVAVVARVDGAILLIRILRIVIPLLCDIPITSHCAQ